MILPWNRQHNEAHNINLCQHMFYTKAIFDIDFIHFFSIENYYYNNLFSSSIHDQNSGNNDKSCDIEYVKARKWIMKKKTIETKIYQSTNVLL